MEETRFLSKVSSLLVAALSLVVFSGWQFRLFFLDRPAPALPLTPPLTAVLLLCLGLALWLLNQIPAKPNGRSWAWAVWVLAGTAVLLALFTAVQYLFALPPSIELWLYPNLVQQIPAAFPGRPSPYTLISCTLSGTALILAPFRQPQMQRISSGFAAISSIVPWMALFGYVTLTDPFYALRSSPHTGMSPLTAAGCLILIIGILAWRPQNGIIGLIRAKSPGGRLVRQLLPLTILLTIFFGWFIQAGAARGWYNPSLAFAISWGFGSLGFAALILYQGFNLHYQFLERKQSVEEREKMLEILVKEEEKFRTLLETAPDSLVIVDEAGKMVIINHQTEVLFQYQRDQLLDQPIEMLLPGRFKNSHPRHRKAFFKNPHARPMGAGLELYGRRQDGLEFPVEVSLNMLKTPEGNLALATIRDVTEQKLAAETLRQFNAKLEERARQMTAELLDRNEELKRQAEALEQSNLELQQFAYVASHDLQTPLRSISGFVQLLKQEYHGQLDEQADEWIDITVESTLRMQTLIRDILAYSRVESPAHPFERVDLNELFHEVTAVLDHDLQEKPKAISTDPLPVVTGNRTQLLLLMQNLISNGLKYNEQLLPTVHVSASPQNGEWIITIRDNGIGINPDHFPKVFDIFRRLHTQDEYPGNGIGLAICRRVVERHGGKIWIESELNNGSTFFFSLPDKGENNEATF